MGGLHPARHDGGGVTERKKSPKMRGAKPAAGQNRTKEDRAAETLRTLRAYAIAERSIRAGQDLFGPGTKADALYVLREGWIFLYSILEDGRRQIVHFAMPGALLGFPAAEGAIATFGAQALTVARVTIIPRKSLENLLNDHPQIGLSLAQLISQDLDVAFDQLTSVGRQSARERVARLLLELFMRYWSHWPGNGIEEMQLPLTQEHIGDATGLTAIHVNRILRGLKQDGVVEFHYRRLRILNPDRLTDIAGVDPQVAHFWLRRRPS